MAGKPEALNRGCPISQTICRTNISVCRFCCIIDRQVPRGCRWQMPILPLNVLLGQPHHSGLKKRDHGDVVDEDVREEQKKTIHQNVGFLTVIYMKKLYTGMKRDIFSLEAISKTNCHSRLFLSGVQNFGCPLKIRGHDTKVFVTDHF